MYIYIYIYVGEELSLDICCQILSCPVKCEASGKLSVDIMILDFPNSTIVMRLINNTL